MKLHNKLYIALCLALIACLAAPALLPANMNSAFSARAEAAISKTKANIYNGKTLKLKVTGTKKTVKWSSSNAEVAKVSQKGKVTALKVGKARITAKFGSKKLTCDVTVKSPVSASATKVTLDAGKSKTITLTYKLDGRLSLKKYDTSLLKCTLGKLSDGACKLTIKAIRAGTQTLTVKNSETSDVVQIKVTVRQGKTSDSIVDRTEVTVDAGDTATVKVTWPYDGVPHMWYDDRSVVNCTFGDWSDGGWPLYIKGVGTGTANVWLTRGDDPKKNIVAKIKVKVN